jgi:hypothetical protein
MKMCNHLGGVEAPCHAHHDAHVPCAIVTGSLAVVGDSHAGFKTAKKSWFEIGSQCRVLSCCNPEGPLTMTADDVLAVHDSLLPREYADSKLPANPSKILTSVTLLCF